MTCVEPDGQVKPAWGVLGAPRAPRGRHVGEKTIEGPCDSHTIPWWKNDVMNLVELGQLSTVFGQLERLEPTDSAGNWKREYTIETVLDALRREMSGSQARLVDSFQIHKLKVVLVGRFFGLYPEILT